MQQVIAFLDATQTISFHQSHSFDKCVFIKCLLYANHMVATVEEIEGKKQTHGLYLISF